MSKKPLILAGAGTALLGGAYGALVRCVCSFAFEREPIIKMPRGNHDEEKVLQGKAWLHEAESELVCRESEDGLKLFAHYYPAENARCTLIEFHGWRGSYDIDFSVSSPYLHERGCNLLLIEERGQGMSDGRYMTFGIRESRDVLPWVKWYQEHIDAEIPIIISGISMGASTVLMAAGEDFPPEVKGMLADCGFTSPYEIIRHVAKQYYHLPEHPICDTVYAAAMQSPGINLKSVDTREILKHTKVPILFVHGERDRFVPCRMSQENYEACCSEKELWICPGAGHGKSFLVDPETYLEKFEQFLGRVL